MSDEQNEKTIFVKARPELKGRVALWERDARHPDGEVLVVGEDVTEVYPTGEVMSRLAPRIQDGGALVRVDTQEPKPTEPTPPKK